MTSKKDINQLIRTLNHCDGVTVRRTRRHYRVYREGLLIAGLPTTPSDWRSLRNARAQLRRAGLAV
ncbi:MAG: hypothetical protein LKI24_11000 [Acidipropionibacterium sp.]|jgi:hypothetical protein|nr:hypothetical protein [Acidipropionibacterium sp.]